jgi:hypothetical protein
MTVNKRFFTLFAAVSFATMALVGCGYVLGSNISVRNQSLETLTNVCVTMANAKLKCSDLPSGETIEFTSRPPTDGTIAVSFVVGGRIHHQEFGYVTPGIRQRHTIIVLPTLEMKYAAES